MFLILINHCSPTRRSPRNHAPVEGLGRTVRVLHERIADTHIDAAHAAICADDLRALRNELNARSGWFANGVYLLHFAACKGASAMVVEIIGNVAIAEGIFILYF